MLSTHLLPSQNTSPRSKRQHGGLRYIALARALRLHFTGLAERTGAAKQTFLYPIDVVRRLGEGDAQGANPYTVQADMGRSLRTHIRMLARVIVGLGRTAPDELVDALAATIHSGALTHKEKGRVSAFAATFEASPYDQAARPPAVRRSCYGALRFAEYTTREGFCSDPRNGRAFGLGAVGGSASAPE